MNRKIILWSARTLAVLLVPITVYASDATEQGRPGITNTGGRMNLQGRPVWADTEVERMAQASTPPAPSPDVPRDRSQQGGGIDSPLPTAPPEPGSPIPPSSGPSAPSSPSTSPSAQPRQVPARPLRPAVPAPQSSLPVVRPSVPTPTVKREPPAQLPPAPAPGSLVQMQFDNIELRDLIRFVSNIMGRNFVFDESVVKGKATVLSPKSLTRDEVFRVFESVLNYQGFAVVPTAEALKIVRAADAKGLAIETLDRQNLGKTIPEEKIATMVCPLEFLDSNTMVGILRPLMARDAYLVSVPTTNSLIMIDTEANLQRLNQVITEIDVPVSKQLSAIDVYNVQHTNAADLAKVLQSLLAEGKKAAAPKEKIFITAYAPTNSLLVSAPPEDMREIRRIIDEVDTFRPQVLVEAAIIEVSVNKSQSLGVEWITGATNSNGSGVAGGNLNADGSLATVASALLNSDSSTAATTIASALGSGLNLAVLGGSITWNGKEYPSVGAFIKAVSSLDNVNILSTPQILTVNNEEAEMVVGENRPYLTSTRVDSAGNPLNSYDYRDVGVKLKIKPYINKDGLLYVNVYTEVTKVTSATIGSGSSAQPAPTTLKRSAKTTVGVKDGQTIVIGGLIQDDSEVSHSGIPVLRSIPLLGWLFGSRSTSSEKTNLLVFITPRIVYTAEALQKLSDTKKAEQEKLLKREKQ